jgi:hypothetical protein
MNLSYSRGARRMCVINLALHLTLQMREGPRRLQYGGPDELPGHCENSSSKTELQHRTTGISQTKITQHILSKTLNQVI